MLPSIRINTVNTTAETITQEILLWNKIKTSYSFKTN